MAHRKFACGHEPTGWDLCPVCGSTDLVERCDCGSGGHPRHCATHPEAYAAHVAELNSDDDRVAPESAGGCLSDMTNEEWFDRVHACEDDDDAIDFVYRSIDEAHDREDVARIDALLAWLDPTKIPLSAALGVLSIAQAPVTAILAWPNKVAVPSMPHRADYERRVAAHVREIDPKDATELLRGLVSDEVLRG